MCERITKLRRNIADTDDAVISMRCRHLYAKAHRSSEKHKRSRAHTRTNMRTSTHAHMHTHMYAQQKRWRAREHTHVHIYTHNITSCSVHMLLQHCRELEQAFQDMWLSYLTDHVGGRGGVV